MESSGINNQSLMNDKRIEMIIEKDSELMEAKSIIDEFSELFYLFSDENWIELQNDIDTYRVKSPKPRRKLYYTKEFELDDEEEVNIKKKIKTEEIYCIKNGITL